MNDLTHWEAELEVRAKEAGDLFAEFVKTVGRLRHPESGCPWDLQQDHLTLRRFLLEEAYEASAAMLTDDSAHILEELGDVLLQVVLNSQVSCDRGFGDVRDVIDSINKKMIRRHPHVFKECGQVKIKVEDVKLNWEKIKAEERGNSSIRKGVFDELRKINPASTQAFKIGKKSHEIKFDWKSLDDVWQHFKSEIKELEFELNDQNSVKIRAELGDVMFTLAQVVRHLGYEPEELAQEGNEKFLQRFAKMEQYAAESGHDILTLNSDELEALWVLAKEQK